MAFSSDPAMVSNQLPISIEFDEENLLEILTLTYKRIANAVNTKEGGLYLPQELNSFNQYFSAANTQKFRNVYRKLFDMVALNAGPIAAGATATFAHGITNLVTCTRIFGTATNSDAPAKFLPLPYVSATLVTDQVQIYLTSTNVVLVNGATQTALTQAYIIAEYVKE